MISYSTNQENETYINFHVRNPKSARANMPPMTPPTIGPTLLVFFDVSLSPWRVLEGCGVEVTVVGGTTEVDV